MTIVGLDLETTSLDPVKGEIIEIAALRFDMDTGKEIARLTTLVKPTGHIPSIVTSITSISDEMVQDKPALPEVLPSLQAFIQPDDIILGHNISFDIAFLAQHGFPLTNNTWDTFLLAASAWPEAESYNLGMLAKMAGITIEGEHRAASDVAVCFALLQIIQERLTVSQATADRIASLLERNNLGHYAPLFSSHKDIKKELKKEIVNPSPSFSFTGSTQDVITTLLQSNGYLETHMPGFTSRPAQLTMATHVSNTLSSGEKVFLEAPTGTGKTFGYLVPAIVALEHNQTEKPLVISTHTRHLQDQLQEKDIPRLLQALGSSRTCAVLKGRANYLCTNALSQALDVPHSEDEVWILIKILVWVEYGGRGDLERLKLTHQGSDYIRSLTADSLSCRFTCTRQTNCPYSVALHEARSADIVIINHSLLAQQAAGYDLPFALNTLIIDEAHHLPGAIRSALKRDLSYYALEKTLEGLTHGLKTMKDVPSSTYIHKELASIPHHYEQFFQNISVAYHAARGDKYMLRLSPAIRRNSSWKGVTKKGEELVGTLNVIIGLSHSLLSHFSENMSRESFEQAIESVRRFVKNLEAFIKGDADRIQWVEESLPNHFNPKPQPRIHDVPLSIATFLTPFFNQLHSVLFTSATLSTGASFAYIKAMLGLPNAREIRLSEGGFDYKSQMLLFIVDDSPHPGQNDFDMFVATVIHDVSAVLGGRTMVLLTSHKAVKSMYNKLNKWLYEESIKLYAQKITGGRNSIIERFKTKQPAVLLGTSSFWEGVDIPGEALSSVIIPKLPFMTPDDPITEALAEEQDKDSFLDFSLPHMILRLRQGIGRLIRTPDDKGVIVLTDARFLKFEYGNEVMKSLPPATIVIGSSAELVPTIETWFGKKVLSEWTQK